MSAPGSRAAGTFIAIGIDVGGTKIAAGIVEFPGGRVRGRRQVPTQPERGGEAVLGEVSRLAEELLREAASDGLRAGAIGLGVCELVDPGGRVVSGNCVAWEGIDVQARLSRLVPAVVEADVRAAALAEAVVGAGRPYGIFIYVTVGTGISSCLVLDGKPYLGARGATGTLASSPWSAECERCGYLSRRSLEEIASGPALAARYAERRPGFAGTGREVLAAAATDEAARGVARSAGEALGVAVGMLVNVLDPGAVIAGGGLGLSVGFYWDAFAASTRRHIWSAVHRDLPILRAATGEDAGVIGAAAAARERFSTGERAVPGEY